MCFKKSFSVCQTSLNAFILSSSNLRHAWPWTWDDVSRPKTNRRRALLANQRRKRRNLPLPSWGKNRFPVPAHFTLLF